MPSLVKMGQQCCGSTARLFPVGGIQEGTIKILTLLIPTRMYLFLRSHGMDPLATSIRALQSPDKPPQHW